MNIFRQRLIDFSQCLKLKAAFRQLRNLRELLVLLNSHGYIYFYHRAMQRPTLASHPKRDFTWSSGNTVLHNQLIGFSSRSEPTTLHRWVHFFIHPSHASLIHTGTPEYHVNNHNEVIIGTWMDSSGSSPGDSTYISISVQPHNRYRIGTIIDPIFLFEEIDIQ